MKTADLRPPRALPSVSQENERRHRTSTGLTDLDFMILQPRTLDELKQALADADASGEKINSIRLESLNQIIGHTPEDMTATAEAGMRFKDFQEQLKARGQWLPLDPPHSDSITIGALVAANLSGPRRFGFGTVRDYLIGIKVVLANGHVIKAGGNVVKNVAGYDLCKLFVGSFGSLGVIVTATFKLTPVPEAEGFVQVRLNSLSQAEALIESILESELTPVVLDLHNLSPRDDSTTDAATIVLGFAGAREDVDYQLNLARELGATEPSNLDHDKKFWCSNSSGPVRRVSILPSRVAETVRQLGAVSFVARAGNGVIAYRGGPELPRPALPSKLNQRVKDAFDPKHTLPSLTL